MTRLNQFTGASTKTLRIRLNNLRADWNSVRSGDGHGGSPGEGILEMIVDLEDELTRRASPFHKPKR